MPMHISFPVRIGAANLGSHPGEVQVTAISTLYSIMIIGVDGFGAQADVKRAASRREVRVVMSSVIGGLRLRQEDVPDTDHGDGVLFWIPPSISPARLVSMSAQAIDAELVARARGRDPADSVRLRIALHCDASSSGADPPDGGVVLADALANARPLQDALRAAARAHVALIISDETYKTISLDAYRRIDTAAFLPVRLDARELGEVTGWVTVPGYSAPPGIEPPTAGISGTGSASEAGPGRATPALLWAHQAGRVPGSRPILVTGGEVSNLVQGDQFVGGDLVFGSRTGGTESAVPPP